MADPVQPSDLFPRWRSSVPRAQPVPFPSPDSDIWQGDVEGHQRWWTSVIRTLFSHGLAPMAQSTRIAYGILDPDHVDDPNHASHETFAHEQLFGTEFDIPGGWKTPTKDRARELNKERTAYIADFKGRWCSSVIDRISYDTARLILDPAQPDLLTNPDKLYAAIQKRAVGGTATEIGPRLFRETNAITWPTKGPDGQAYTMVQQADHIISQYRTLAARFAQLADVNYQLTEAAMVAQIIMRTPPAFDMSVIAKLEACQDLTSLQGEFRTAARRIDERAPTGLNAFAAIGDTTAVSTRLDLLESSMSKIETALTALARKRGGGPKITEQRRMDQAAGGIRPGDQYCSSHGWGRHTSDHCYALHPELAPAGWGSNRK